MTSSPSALPRAAGALDVSGRAPAPGGARPLTTREKDMLALEGGAAHGRRKAELMDQLFPGLSPVRYWQALNQLVDRPEAAEYAPEVVRRLLEVRGRRHQRNVPSSGPARS